MSQRPPSTAPKPLNYSSVSKSPEIRGIHWSLVLTVSAIAIGLMSASAVYEGLQSLVASAMTAAPFLLLAQIAWTARRNSRSQWTLLFVLVPMALLQFWVIAQSNQEPFATLALIGLPIFHCIGGGLWGLMVWSSMRQS